MSADFEKYLEKMRSGLDVETPDDQKIWEGIRGGIAENMKPVVPMWVRLRNIAAGLIILLSLGYMVTGITGNLVERRRVSLRKIDQSLGLKEKEYRSMINVRLKEIDGLGNKDNLIIEEILEEIQHLDTIYDQLLNDLGSLGYDEKVINTIFDTYEKKIYLLELIILENNKIENYETNEKILL